jgi:hypothetical protein
MFIYIISSFCHRWGKPVRFNLVAYRCSRAYLIFQKKYKIEFKKVTIFGNLAKKLWDEYFNLVIISKVWRT